MIIQTRYFFISGTATPCIFSNALKCVLSRLAGTVIFRCDEPLLTGFLNVNCRVQTRSK